MAGTITFDDGTNPAVNLGGVVYPEEEGYSYPMPTEFVFSGGIRTHDPGDGTDWQRPVIHFRNMTDTDYNNLVTFIRTTVEWSKTPFQYTDPNGTNITNCHYIGGLETFRSSRGDRWSGTLRLHKDITA